MEELFEKEVKVPELRVINGRWHHGFNTYDEMTPAQVRAFEAKINEAKETFIPVAI